MEHRPLISIITPCHRVIPWFNARLINVCSQSFKDWEWIILDNSKDGCVKKYVEDFFVNMQGVHYPECRDKIKCVHEPFEGVSVKDGRMGLLRNRCMELTSCSDDGWILTLDSDDFIYDGFLETIYEVSKYYHYCEAISGMLQMSFIENIETGEFLKTDSQFWMSCTHSYDISIMRKNGFNGIGFDDMANEDVDGKQITYKLVEYENRLCIPYTNLVFSHDRITRLDDRGYSFFDSIQHPIVFKKGAFKKKIGGYATVTSAEDCITHIMPHVFDNVVYVDKPCYMLVTLTDGNCDRVGVTVDVVNNADWNTDYIVLNMVYNRVYSALGDCRKYSVPIRWTR